MIYVFLLGLLVYVGAPRARLRVKIRTLDRAMADNQTT